MSLIIDGHNLIGAMPDIDLADPEDEAMLLARLRSYRAVTGQSLVVFFDGVDLSAQFPAPSSPGIQVHFSSPGETADDAIVAFLRSRAEPGQYAVVTDDRDLADRARGAGASIISATDFALRLSRRPAFHPDRPATASPDPRDPAFADIYTRFLRTEQSERVLSAEHHGDIDSWVERLYGDDATEAQHAASWLGLHAGPQAFDALLDALTHSDPYVRSASALALADLGDLEAVPILAARLAHDEASLVRQAAAQSLGHLGDRRAEPALEAAAEDDPKAKVRKAARVALEQIRARHSR